MRCGFRSALLLVLLTLGACAPARLSPQQAIVGAWQNVQGGAIEFHADGTGFIPGVAGSIADSTFAYRFEDERHLTLALPGQPELTLEITVEGDLMTWRGVQSGKEFRYTRATKSGN